ncbi:APG12-domain-containing protein, partial [Suhomyces tanzawaensis NRRL Y-17324]
ESIEENAVLERIPLSTLTMLERLPPEQKERLDMARVLPQARPSDSKDNAGQIDSYPPTKLTIRLLPVGSTPAITPKVHTISSTQKISTIAHFLGRKLRHKGPIYMYIQNSFQPTPDETLGNLHTLFKTNNELIISYCYSVAFG